MDWGSLKIGEVGTLFLSGGTQNNSVMPLRKSFESGHNVLCWRRGGCCSTMCYIPQGHMYYGPVHAGPMHLVIIMTSVNEHTHYSY